MLRPGAAFRNCSGLALRHGSELQFAALWAQDWVPNKGPRGPIPVHALPGAMEPFALAPRRLLQLLLLLLRRARRRAGSLVQPLPWPTTGRSCWPSACSPSTSTQPQRRVNFNFVAHHFVGVLAAATAPAPS